MSRTLIVAGALANKPMRGGAAWVRLSWVLGLKRLGFDVWFVECIDSERCVDALGETVPFEESVNLAYFRHVTSMFGLQNRSVLVQDEGEHVYGARWADLLDVAERATLLVNITGHLDLAAIKRRIGRKAYVDLDPGYTQLWSAGGDGGARLAGHDRYFTVGANIGRPDCAIPTLGITWRTLRPPVVMEHWNASEPADPGRFTTVAHWRGPYGPVEHQGAVYGQKAHEFRKFMRLPEGSPHVFELALEIHPGDAADLDLLRLSGWRTVDPATVAWCPGAYRNYVCESAAEFSVAQGVYVGTQSGWFSDRTAVYLAAGRPALVQDTGLSRHYPAGEGLIPFGTLDEATVGAERIMSDYARHSQAARAIAEEYFDSDVVLPDFLREAGVDV